MEQQLARAQEEFQAQLSGLQAEAVPAEELSAIVELAHHEAEGVELDEADTRQLIDAQLREAEWEADTIALRYSNGTRPVKGRNLAIAEWPTQTGPADYVLFQGLTPLTVVEGLTMTRPRSVAGNLTTARASRGGFHALCGAQAERRDPLPIQHSPLKPGRVQSTL